VTAAVQDVGGGRETGSATILVLACSMVVLAAGGLGTALEISAVARHRAAAAADLAALAAAGALRDGDAATACARAARVAVGGGAVLRQCDAGGTDALVVVTVRLALPGAGEARAAARAGPERLTAVGASAGRPTLPPYPRGPAAR